MPDDSAAVQYRVIGMDCARDAAEVERAVGSVAGVRSVRVSAATHLLTLQVDDLGARSRAVANAVAELGYGLAPLEADPPAIDAASTAPPPAHLSPAYARALRRVVLLNVGYGAVEMVGGFLSESQALKADALDFLGDGLITLLGLLAIGWSLAWRARAALLQGIFLGVLGVGVLANTGYRVLVQEQPQADLMGALGFLALLVNVAAAAVLLPHRSGDANVRAVWLFSRNDAIGNAAVVAAAGLVAWTGSPWPDLVVALAIAALFLHASWAIVRDARADLRSGAAAAASPAGGAARDVSGAAASSPPSTPER